MNTLKTIILCTVISVFYSICEAQGNLVPNPSFEDYSICPDINEEITSFDGCSS